MGIKGVGLLDQYEIYYMSYFWWYGVPVGFWGWAAAGCVLMAAWDLFWAWRRKQSDFFSVIIWYTIALGCMGYLVHYHKTFQIALEIHYYWPFLPFLLIGANLFIMFLSCRACQIE